MAYSTQTWADNAGGGTPVNASRLNHMEAGIAAAHANGVLPSGGSNNSFLRKQSATTGDFAWEYFDKFDYTLFHEAAADVDTDSVVFQKTGGPSPVRPAFIFRQTASNKGFNILSDDGTTEINFLSLDQANSLTTFGTPVVVPDLTVNSSGSQSVIRVSGNSNDIDLVLQAKGSGDLIFTTTSAGLIAFNNFNTTVGGATATADGFLTILVNGVTKKLAYYS